MIVMHESVPAKTLAELSRFPSSGRSPSALPARQRHPHDAGAADGGDRREVRAVPYRGGGALVPDMVSGTISGAMTEISTALPHNGGKVRIVVIASAARSPQVPDVATVIETGVKDFTAASFVGILAPAKTPAEIISVLEGALGKALAVKATQDKFLASGAELTTPALQTSKGFADYLKREFEASREAAKIAGLTPQ